MKDQHSVERDQALWLSPEDQARLAAFKAYAVNHALLEDIDTRLTQAILEPAGFAHVLVYGPSGVGKTTLLRRTERRVQELYTRLAMPSEVSAQGRYLQGNPAPPSQPLVGLEAHPLDGLIFNRADYYRSALAALGESSYKQWSLVDIHVDQTWETKTRSKSTGRVAQFNDSPELRHALEEALVRRGVRAVIVDEAQHLMKVASGAKLLDQLDWIKSMTNMTNVLHVLVGTYDLLDFRNLNGQAARRGHDLHFPRYQFQHEADRKAFQGTLHALLLQVPLDMDMQDLMNHWYYFYERSIGCVGVLKDWLVRTVASSLCAGMRTLTLARLEHHALSNAQCESMAADAHAAEQKLHYTESSREHLWTLLGMSGIPLGESRPSPGPSPDHAATSPPPASARTKVTPGRVGQRAPSRDPVGETVQEEKATRCSFSGVIDVRADQIARASVARVECPECGAMRTLHPQGGTTRFPSHPKRLTNSPRNEVRWIRRGTTWELSDKKASFTEAQTERE
jgi:energy-coupling factor transporter ATP-binding protein EcfA2